MVKSAKEGTVKSLVNLPQALHRELRKVQIDIEEKDGEKLTLQALIVRAVEEFVAKHKS